jgi:hypothetical protein
VISRESIPRKGMQSGGGFFSWHEIERIVETKVHLFKLQRKISYGFSKDDLVGNEETEYHEKKNIHQEE